MVDGVANITFEICVFKCLRCLLNPVSGRMVKITIQCTPILNFNFLLPSMWWPKDDLKPVFHIAFSLTMHVAEFLCSRRVYKLKNKLNCDSVNSSVSSPKTKLTIILHW